MDDEQPPRGSAAGRTSAAFVVTAKLSAASTPLVTGAQAAGVSLLQLFVYFLTIGSVLYGSGYVLFAFLEGGLVEDLGWLTQQQLIDAVAIGQFTPGPVLSTATFVGYVVAGPAGAALATLGIFIPSFVFVSLLARILPRIRESKLFSAFLDGLNASAVALMAVVTLRLALAAFTSTEAVLIGIVAAVAALWLRVNAAFLVAAGAVAGWLLF
jgi:chromate transporter